MDELTAVSEEIRTGSKTKVEIKGVVATQFTFNIFGYSLYLSLWTVFVLMGISQIPYTVWLDENKGLPSVDESIYWMFGPMAILALASPFFGTCNIAFYDQKDWPDCGPENALRTTLPTYLVCFGVFNVGVPLLFSNFLGISSKFYLFDLLLLPMAFVLSIVIDSFLRRKRQANKINVTPAPEQTFEDNHSSKNVSMKELLLTVFTQIVQLVVVILYPILIIPLYRSTTDQIRLVFVCGIHPLLQESLLTMLRFTRTNQETTGELVVGGNERSTFELQLM